MCYSCFARGRFGFSDAADVDRQLAPRDQKLKRRRIEVDAPSKFRRHRISSGTCNPKDTHAHHAAPLYEDRYAIAGSYSIRRLPWFLPVENWSNGSDFVTTSQRTSSSIRNPAHRTVPPYCTKLAVALEVDQSFLGQSCMHRKTNRRLSGNGKWQVGRNPTAPPFRPHIQVKPSGTYRLRFLSPP